MSQTEDSSHRATLAALLAVVGTLGSGNAWGQVPEAPSVLARVMALRESDPEMFQFIAAMSARSRTQIDGGFSWEVQNAQLDCDESFEGGFDECSVDVEVSVTSHAQAPDWRNADVEIECEVALATSQASGFPHTERETETGSELFSSGGTQTADVSLRFDLYSPADPVLHAKLSDVACEIRDIR